MRRVLIVSPHFPPSNAADMHRVRLLLPYFATHEWDAEVIAASSGCVASPRDDWLCKNLPENVNVHRVNGMSLGWSRIPGLGQLVPRIYHGFRKTGNNILKSQQFDLAYFSTTQFGINKLGPYWKNKFGLPFVLDYQDPWVNDYYQRNPNVIPPGGRIKYAVSHWLSQRLERRVLKQCNGVTSVSRAYVDQLTARYKFLAANFPRMVLPFPGDDQDLQCVRNDSSIKQSVFDPKDGMLHWVYVGRGSDDMHPALRGLFHALKAELRSADRCEYASERQEISGRDKGDLARVKIHFVGTSYASKGKGKKSVQPLAAEYGLQNLVSESTDRIPYSETLRCLLDADALIVPGSDDPGYTASKIYPYLLARKPLLTIFHEKSSVNEIIRKVGGATSVQFSSEDTPQSLGNRIQHAWTIPQNYNRAIPFDETAFSQFSAKHQAKTLTSFFNECSKPGKQK